MFLVLRIPTALEEHLGNYLSLFINASILLSYWQVFSNIEEYAPGFTDSIIGMEVLTPPDLEEIFGLTGGVSYVWLLVSCHFMQEDIATLCQNSNPYSLTSVYPVNQLIWKSLNFETLLPFKRNEFLLVHMLGNVSLCNSL